MKKTNLPRSAKKTVKKDPRARSEGNTSITISCTQELKDRITQEAAESGRTVSQWIVFFAKELLDHKQREKDEQERLNAIAMRERSQFTENRKARHA